MWYNRIMEALLRSPLHGVISGGIMLVTYQGRRSGKRYATPVNYTRLARPTGEMLLTTSIRQRVWWRNLRGGARVALQLRGRRVFAQAEVVEEPELVAQGLAEFFRAAPKMARYYNVGLDTSGEPDPADLQREAAARVLVYTRVVEVEETTKSFKG